MQISSLHNGPTISLPLFDYSVSAGTPSYVTGTVDRTIDLNRELVLNPHDSFCVRVNGQSMVDAGIDNGDLLVVDKKIEPEDGRIVLAVVNGDFTVKRLIKRNGRVILQPENQAFQPLEIDAYMDFRIWGVVTGVIKSFL